MEAQVTPASGVSGEGCCVQEPASSEARRVALSPQLGTLTDHPISEGHQRSVFLPLPTPDQEHFLINLPHANPISESLPREPDLLLEAQLAIHLAHSRLKS